ncbi:hypothetical protein Q5O89_17035 [Peribacillus frigoritolerans]|nr:hypothetical protein [Peribacillus frigoritolerans]
MQDNQHGSQMTEVEKFDEWVKSFFLDPETCALDHQLFQLIYTKVTMSIWWKRFWKTMM